MKFIVAVDLEGAACVVGKPNTTLSNSSDYEFACHQATKEANAAVKALYDCGAEQVIVWDNHGGGVNLLYESLDERCDIILGCGEEHRWPSLNNEFSGVLMIGYHSKDNTSNAVLAHSFSSQAYQWLKINGVEVGEIAIDGAMAGELGIPVIFVSSDDKGVTEAKYFMPWAGTVATKYSLGWNNAISKHPVRAISEIYEGTKDAMARLDQMKPFSFDMPLSFEIRFKRLEDAQKELRKGKCKWESMDPYTVRCSLKKLSDYF